MPTSGMSDEERDRFYTDFNRLQTLILDSIQRLAVLETGERFATTQRQTLLNSVEQLGTRLENTSRDLVTYQDVRKEVDHLKVRSDEFDRFMREISGGAKLAKILWGAVGLVIGLILAYLKLGTH